jgi:hypothetical protein
MAAVNNVPSMLKVWGDRGTSVGVIKLWMETKNNNLIMIVCLLQ